jgi:superfamily II DNA/RNA helicase
LVPLIQQLKQQELFDGYERRNQRPRLLIVAPTRELVKQIASVLKVLSHRCKFSSTAVTGGEDFGAQRKKLMKPIDVVVATPGRLLKHWNAQNLFLSNLQHVVLDECDTMMEQGFTAELQQILYPILYRKQASSEIDVKRDLKDTAPIVVLTSATMTRSVQKMIHDHDTSILAKRHHHKVVENEPPQQRSILLPRMKVIKAPGLHKAVPRLKQIFIDVGGSDKLSLLVDVLSSGGSGAAIAQNKMDANALNMVFCNTAASCQAVQFALAEARIESLAYHGELNSAARSENLDLFRQAGSDPLNESIPRVLVCTDLAARGLDVPQVDHVIMFDFPLNSLDYLHRSGRTARGLSNSRQGNGRVTALVSKRDRVLANAIEIAVQRGDPLDGLSSRKSDYLPGGRLGGSSSSGSKVSSGSRFSKVSSGSKSSRLTIGKSKSGSKSSKFTVSNSGSRSSSSRGTYGKSTTGTKGRRPAMALKKSTSRRSSGSKSVSLRKRP